MTQDPRPTPETEAQEKLRDMILDERKKGNVVLNLLPDQMGVMALDDIIQQPADWLLYDLNRSEEVCLTFINDKKWVNDFACAQVIRKLHGALQSEREARERAEAELKSIMDFVGIESDETASQAVLRNNDGWKKRCEKAEAALAEAQKDAARFFAWFSDDGTLQTQVTESVLVNNIETVTIDDWRAAIDAAIERGRGAHEAARGGTGG